MFSCQNKLLIVSLVLSCLVFFHQWIINVKWTSFGFKLPKMNNTLCMKMCRLKSERTHKMMRLLPTIGLPQKPGLETKHDNIFYTTTQHLFCLFIQPYNWAHQIDLRRDPLVKRMRNEIFGWFVTWKKI